MNPQPLLHLVAAGLAGVLAAKMLHAFRAPPRLSLDGLAADAPRWHAELTGRNDD